MAIGFAGDCRLQCPDLDPRLRRQNSSRRRTGIGTVAISITALHLLEVYEVASLRAPERACVIIKEANGGLGYYDTLR